MRIKRKFAWILLVLAFMATVPPVFWKILFVMELL